MNNTRTFFILFSLSALVFQNSAHAQSLSKIDKRDLQKWVSILASDSLEGRGTGTGGQQKAEKFIADRFGQLGLIPFTGDSYLQKIDFTESYWGDVFIKAQDKKLDNFDQIVFQGKHSQDHESQNEIVFGGTGTEEELDQVEVKGRYVLIFVNNLRSDYNLRVSLSKRNAAGVILANPQNDKQFESIKTSLRQHALQKVLKFANPPVTRDTVNSLFAKWDSVQTVVSFLIPNHQVRTIMGVPIKELQSAILKNKIDAVPVSKIVVQYERINRKISAANVIGMIRGRTDKTIVISAHYDHLGISDKTYFPGADDNASGTAALLELAEEFAKKDLEYNMVFLATTAEESGLMGSYYHVNQPGFNASGILCNLNIDMIARGDETHTSGQYLYCIGSSEWQSLDGLIRKADEMFKPCSFDYSLNNTQGLYARSDQYNFYKKGIPAIFFFSGLHADYHAITDTPDKINFKNLEERVGLIGTVISVLQASKF